jgi:hypothetical protein
MQGLTDAWWVDDLVRWPPAFGSSPGETCPARAELGGGSLPPILTNLLVPSAASFSLPASFLYLELSPPSRSRAQRGLRQSPGGDGPVDLDPIS